MVLESARYILVASLWPCLHSRLTGYIVGSISRLTDTATGTAQHSRSARAENNVDEDDSNATMMTSPKVGDLCGEAGGQCGDFLAGGTLHCVWRVKDVSLLLGWAGQNLVDEFFVFEVSVQILTRVCPFQDVLNIFFWHSLTQVLDHMPQLS